MWHSQGIVQPHTGSGECGSHRAVSQGEAWAWSDTCLWRAGRTHSVGTNGHMSRGFPGPSRGQQWGLGRGPHLWCEGLGYGSPATGTHQLSPGRGWGLGRSERYFARRLAPTGRGAAGVPGLLVRDSGAQASARGGCSSSWGRRSSSSCLQWASYCLCWGTRDATRQETQGTPKVGRYRDARGQATPGGAATQVSCAWAGLPLPSATYWPVKQ